MLLCMCSGAAEQKAIQTQHMVQIISYQGVCR